MSEHSKFRLLLSKATAECIGTLALVLFGCGAVAASQLLPDKITPGQIPVVFGLVISTMIYATGHLSGAHFNPAVTVAFAATGTFPWRQVPAYIAAQVVGATGGALLIRILLGAGVDPGTTVPATGLAAAFAWEFIMTFFLMFVIYSVATDARAVGTMAGISIGSTVALCAFVGGPFTGASMNPARSLGPALVSGTWDSLWLYFVATVPAAVLAALLYRKIRCETEAEDAGGGEAGGCC